MNTDTGYERKAKTKEQLQIEKLEALLDTAMDHAAFYRSELRASNNCFNDAFADFSMEYLLYLKENKDKDK